MLASIGAPMESIWEAGILIIQSIQRVEWLDWPMQWVTGLGSQTFFLLFITLLYWCIDTALGIRVALILLLSTSVNSAIKLAFAHPRPYWYSPQIQTDGLESSFGLPSGHAQNSVAVWGMVGRFVHRWWSKLLLVLLVLLISFSRIYLGVHFPTDVLVGWMLGGLLLGLMAWADRPLQHWMKPLKFSTQCLMALLSSLLLLLPSVVMMQLRATWQLPPAWVQILNQTPGTPLPQPLSLDTAIATAGTWLGLSVGLFWLQNQTLAFSAQVPGPVRLRRYVIGISGAIALLGGLDALSPHSPTLLAAGCRYLRYALVGGWITAGAPLLFHRLERRP